MMEWTCEPNGTQINIDIEISNRPFSRKETFSNITVLKQLKYSQKLLVFILIKVKGVAQLQSNQRKNYLQLKLSVRLKLL